MSGGVMLLALLHVPDAEPTCQLDQDPDAGLERALRDDNVPEDPWDLLRVERRR